MTSSPACSLAILVTTMVLTHCLQLADLESMDKLIESHGHLSRVKRQAINNPQDWYGSRGMKIALEVPIPTNIGFFPGGNKTADVCSRNKIEMSTGGSCEAPLTKGICDIKEEVILDPETNKGICVPKLCPPNRVFVHLTQLCHDPLDHLICPPGRELFYSAHGTPVCACPDGTIEGDDDLDDDVCEPILGSSMQCMPGQVFWFRDFQSPPMCLPDPCGGQNLQRGSNQLPFIPDYQGKCIQMGSSAGVCPDNQYFSLSYESLTGKCSSLDEAGYVTLDSNTLNELKTHFSEAEATGGVDIYANVNQTAPGQDPYIPNHLNPDFIGFNPGPFFNAGGQQRVQQPSFVQQPQNSFSGSSIGQGGVSPPTVNQGISTSNQLASGGFVQQGQNPSTNTVGGSPSFAITGQPASKSGQSQGTNNNISNNGQINPNVFGSQDQRISSSPNNQFSPGNPTSQIPSSQNFGSPNEIVQNGHPQPTNSQSGYHSQQSNGNVPNNVHFNQASKTQFEDNQFQSNNGQSHPQILTESSLQSQGSLGSRRHQPPFTNTNNQRINENQGFNGHNRKNSHQNNNFNNQQRFQSHQHSNFNGDQHQGFDLHSQQFNSPEVFESQQGFNHQSNHGFNHNRNGGFNHNINGASNNQQRGQQGQQSFHQEHQFQGQHQGGGHNNQQQQSIEMGGLGFNSPEVFGQGNNQQSFEVFDPNYGMRLARSLGVREPPVRAHLAAQWELLPGGQVANPVYHSYGKRSITLENLLENQWEDALKASSRVLSRKRRDALPYASPSNVFETRLLGCRPGSVRDINSKCRNTILPARIPKRRGTRGAPPIPPTPSCGPDKAFNIRRQCVDKTTAQNSIVAFNLG